MKFRGLMIESQAMRDFLNVSLSLSKFSKTCVLRLTKKNLFFIVSDEETGPRCPLVWCELLANFYFKEYNIVGVTETQNEIYLELSTVLLAQCCALLKNDVKEFKIKLTNKESPCLTLEIDLKSGELVSRQCVHDIPVEIISRKHWDEYQKPSFEEFHISLQLPNLKSMKNIVEKMRHLHQHLSVSANRNGDLTLRIKTTTVDLKAQFPNLNVNSFAGDSGETSAELSSAIDSVSATIDIKKFLMFLTGMQLNHSIAKLNIVDKKMVKLFMEQPGAWNLQIFLAQFLDL